MKILPDIYRLILEAEAPPPEPEINVPINPPRKESGAVLYELLPPGFGRRLNPYERLTDTERDDTWFGWDEWTDPTQPPPANWPHIRDPRGRIPPIAYPAERPSDYPPWEEWPPPPGSDYYVRYQTMMNAILNRDIPTWIDSPAKLYKWFAGVLNNEGLSAIPSDSDLWTNFWRDVVLLLVTLRAPFDGTTIATQETLGQVQDVKAPNVVYPPNYMGPGYIPGWWQPTPAPIVPPTTRPPSNRQFPGTPTRYY